MPKNMAKKPKQSWQIKYEHKSLQHKKNIILHAENDNKKVKRSEVIDD